MADSLDTTGALRRLFLAAGPAAAVFGAVSAAAHASPDAALITLGHQLRAAWAVERAGFSVSVSDDAADKLVDACTALAKQIEALPAKTIEGLKVKAEAVSWCHCGEFDGFGDFTDQRIATGMIRDLLAMVGEG